MLKLNNFSGGARRSQPYQMAQCYCHSSLPYFAGLWKYICIYVQRRCTSFLSIIGLLVWRTPYQRYQKILLGKNKKLYIPFALWCIISAILLLISTPHRISWSALFSQLAMYRCLPGQEHLWFMQDIFVCYLLVPLVDFVLTKNVPVPVIFAVTLWGIVLHIHYIPTLIWIALYFIGYTMGRWRNMILYLTSVSINIDNMSISFSWRIGSIFSRSPINWDVVSCNIWDHNILFIFYNNARDQNPQYYIKNCRIPRCV